MIRQEFSNPVKRAAHDRSGGICECYRIQGVAGLIPGGCNQKLGAGNTYYEHIDPDGKGGKPTLDNCAVLTKTCWKIKTHTFDQQIVAKAKRQLDRNRGIGRRNGPPMPGSRNSPFKKLMIGTTERRA